LAGEADEGALGEEESGLEDLSAAKLAQRAKPVWYVHEPYNDCEKCHTRESGGTYSSRGNLRALVPGLCYGCHEAYTERTGFLHGPAAVGQCLFCHDPHRSRNEYLLTKPIPEQCYLCHESKQMESIANHSAESYSKCHNCHESHASSEESLLKRDWPGKTD